MSARPDYSGDRPSTAQPPPRLTAGESMHDVAARDAAAYGYRRVAQLLGERRRFGLRKYGTLLRAHNGRNPICDAVEELLDALVYLAQAVTEERRGARLLYHGVLALTGAAVRLLPPEAALPAPLPDTRPGGHP